MRAVDYLSLMREKGVSFRVVQHGLKFNNLSSAKGWEPLIEHYNEVDDEYINNVLKELYISQLFHGQRTVYFSKINGGNPKQITENIERASQVISSIYYTTSHKNISIYRDNYPLPIDETNLYKVPLNNPCPVFIEQSGDNIRLVMTYPRAYKERVIIDVDDIEFSDPDASHFSGYDEIIGIKSGRAQSFDCIQINKNTGIIQFQIDHSKNILKDDIDKAVIRYRHMLMDSYKNMFGVTIPWNKINIHTKIDELYNSNDGRVHNLEHATVTGSVKTEKMRKRVDDLRDESFHLAGLDAIDGDTSNFCITKQWDGECGSSLKLTIDGGVTLAARSNPEIDCATLEGCITEDDFNLLISKVL